MGPVGSARLCLFAQTAHVIQSKASRTGTLCDLHSRSCLPGRRPVSGEEKTAGEGPDIGTLTVLLHFIPTLSTRNVFSGEGTDLGKAWAGHPGTWDSASCILLSSPLSRTEHSVPVPCAAVTNDHRLADLKTRHLLYLKWFHWAEASVGGPHPQPPGSRRFVPSLFQLLAWLSLHAWLLARFSL